MSDSEERIEGYTYQEIDAAAQVIHDFLIAQGRATKDEIRRYCNAAGIPTPLYQKALERLGRQLKVTTEVINEDGKKALALKDWAKGVSLRTIVEIAVGITSDKKPKEVFDQWYQVKGTLRLTSPCLASNPDLEEASARRFHRYNGSIVLLAGYFEAMAKVALQKPGAPSVGSGGYRIQWDEVQMPAETVIITPRPVPPSRRGEQGRGVTSCESLPPGTEVPFCATVPGSHINQEEFETLLTIAGRWVGFSPSSAHKGFGRFIPKPDKEVDV